MIRCDERRQGQIGVVRLALSRVFSSSASCYWWGSLGFDPTPTPMLSRDALQALALFESLNDDQLDQILDRHRESTHQADQVIVMEQDWGESLFLLCDGLAKVRTYTADGDEVVMSLLGVGDVFGEMAALDGGIRSADVVALTPLRLVKLRVPHLRLFGKGGRFCVVVGEAGGISTEGSQPALCLADRRRHHSAARFPRLSGPEEFRGERSPGFDPSDGPTGDCADRRPGA